MDLSLNKNNRGPKNPNFLVPKSGLLRKMDLGWSRNLGTTPTLHSKMFLESFVHVEDVSMKCSVLVSHPKKNNSTPV